MLPLTFTLFSTPASRAETIGAIFPPLRYHSIGFFVFSTPRLPIQVVLCIAYVCRSSSYRFSQYYVVSTFVRHSATASYSYFFCVVMKRSARPTSGKGYCRSIRHTIPAQLTNPYLTAQCSTPHPDYPQRGKRLSYKLATACG